jgi:xanthine dehydrogenase YagS FAD-binding subunit
VVVTVDGGRVARARIALGGVGTKPWRATEAEALLIDATVGERAFRVAADAALSGALPRSQNGFKVELARRCLVHALKQATQTA